MTILISIQLVILNKDIKLNKCSLKMFLIRISQEMLNNIKDSTGIKTLVMDYSSQKYNFILKVVFLYYNNCLVYLIIIIHTQELLNFVVDQLEIINNKFYILKISIILIYILSIKNFF